jgi:hypothetical protein
MTDASLKFQKKDPKEKKKLCVHPFASWKRNKLNLGPSLDEHFASIDKGRHTEIKYIIIKH